ncbi:MAG: large conductance mechanosensitive channel protein MscL [Myxococcaceae bacterium]|nr:large conductance mechanosensitive channel protein MscL [Myxococcaceae bacterium]MCI0670116.1 large conductance mechanosensitive channel protein MscL [Myxococcaceae bacterium]
MSLWKEFKEFVSKGNVIGLAVAVVLGGAFGAVVVSFTNDILMQLIAAVGGRPDFSKYSVTVNGSEIRYGSFLTAVVSFLIVTAAIFLVVKAINRLLAFRRKQETAAQETELELLRQIRDSLQQQQRRTV